MTSLVTQRARLAPGGSAAPKEGPGTAHLNHSFLHPGQVYVSRERESLVLILGSCVAVCVWDPVSGIGGATHYLLPNWDGRGIGSARYGNVAIPFLLQKLVEAGADPKQFRAMVFGGGCLFETMREDGTKKDHLGSRNIEVAKEILAEKRVHIASTNVGGERGKRIVFNTATGEATVKEL